MSNYVPFIKPTGFCPNPVAKYGIPIYADSSIRKDVMGTSAHQQWWEEQLDYCLNGYTTAGTFIPGRYYYYLNFFLMATVKRGNHYPDYVDLDLEFFNLVEHVKKERKGIISAKARRKGLSYKVVGGIFDYGFRFNERYEAGICAGLQTHSDDFYDKFRIAQSLKVKEFRVNILTDNKEETISGYEVKEDGMALQRGMFNTIYCKTMQNNPNVFKGKKLEDCVFEEAGEFPLLVEAFNATKPCFMAGSAMVGTPYVYGTGGNMESGSRGFLEMWTEADKFGLEKFLVPATRLYMPYFSGSKDEYGKENQITPNLMHLSEDERVGVEDIQAAEDVLMAERRELAKAGNLRSYYDHMQNYPLTEKEIFLKFNGNDFNFDLLNEQMFRIQSNPVMWRLYKLEWIKDKEGKILSPMRVEAVEVFPENIRLDGSECYVKIYQHPEKQVQGLDIAGTDSYDIDKSRASKSLGAMVVFRRKNNVSGKAKRTPVALIRDRPKRKEIFYETCLKLSVYYDTLYTNLIDVAKPGIINYFEQMGCARYLSERPRSIESLDSQQVNKYGFNFNNQSKIHFIGLLQTWIEDDIRDCWFEEIIKDLLEYDIKSKDSDCDSADALGIALIKDMDMRSSVQERNVVVENDPWALPTWEDDGFGNPVISGTGKMKDLQQDEFLKTLYGNSY